MAPEANAAGATSANGKGRSRSGPNGQVTAGVAMIVELDFDEIEFVQLREFDVSQEHVERLIEAIEAGAKLPPAKGKLVGDKVIVWDGKHTATARAKLGHTVIVEVTAGRREDAVLAAASANSDHGLPRTNADKRNQVIAVLELHKDWTDGRIAEWCTVTQPFVTSVRGTDKRYECAERIGKDGKIQRVTKARRKKAKADAASEPLGTAVSVTGEERAEPAAIERDQPIPDCPIGAVAPVPPLPEVPALPLVGPYDAAEAGLGELPTNEGTASVAVEQDGTIGTDVPTDGSADICLKQETALARCGADAPALSGTARLAAAVTQSLRAIIDILPPLQALISGYIHVLPPDAGLAELHKLDALLSVAHPLISTLEATLKQALSTASGVEHRALQKDAASDD